MNIERIQPNELKTFLNKKGIPFSFLGTLMLFTYQISFFLATSNYFTASFSDPGKIDLEIVKICIQGKA